MFHTKPSSADAVALSCAPARALGDDVSATAVGQRNLKIVERVHPARRRATVDRSSAKSREELLVEKILQAFNTWSFKREQPDNLASLHQVIGHAVRLKEAVPFVLYLGKGPRRHIGKPEITSLNYLRAFADRIRRVYGAGAAIRLICTDTHADLNGHSPQAISDYFGLDPDRDACSRLHRLPAHRSPARGREYGKSCDRRRHGTRSGDTATTLGVRSEMVSR